MNNGFFDIDVDFEEQKETDFVLNNREHLTEYGQPIYEDADLMIIHSLQYSVPGMYCVYYKNKPRDLRDISVEVWLKTLFIFKYIRTILRDVFGFELATHMFEKRNKNDFVSVIIPFSLKIFEKFCIPPACYQPDIERYIKSFNFNDNAEYILMINNYFRIFFKSDDFVRKENFFKTLFLKINESNDTIFHIENNFPLLNNVKKIEVDFLSELPDPPFGLKYFECLGGNKEYECFLDDATLTKGYILKKYGNYLDEVLHDMYNFNGVFVKQDATRPVPGFCVVGANDIKPSIYKMKEVNLIRTGFVVKKLADILLNDLKFDNIYICCDEKFGKTAHTHFWIIPLVNKQLEKYNIQPYFDKTTFWNYFTVFDLKDKKQEILQKNKLIREYISKNNIIKNDDNIFKFYGGEI